MNKNYAIGLLVVIFLILVVLLGINMSSTGHSISEEGNQALEQIHISEESFVILSHSFLNKGYYTFKEDCVEKDMDSLNVNMRLINFPIPIDDVYSEVVVKAYTNGQPTGWKEYDLNEDYVGTDYNLGFRFSKDNSLPMVSVPLRVNQDNKVTLCFQINDTMIAETDMILVDASGKINAGEELKLKAGQQYGILSNEVCLDPISVSALC